MSVKQPRRILIGLMGMVLTGCAGGAPSFNGMGGGGAIADNPAKLRAILASTNTPAESRMAADRRLVEKVGKTDEGRLALLEQIVWGIGHEDAMRIYAMDALAEADANRAGRLLGLHLPRMEEWEVLAHAAALAARLGDLRLVDPLVRSLERPATTFTREKRPEAIALQGLTGKALVEVLEDRLLTAQDTSVRVAALDLLPELAGDAAAKDVIRRAARPDDFLAALQWWVSMFDTLPVGGQEVAWVRQFSRERGAVEGLAGARKRMGKESDVVVAPRFAGTAEAVGLRGGATREALVAAIRGMLEGKEHLRREPSHAGARDDLDESLGTNLDKLSRMDLWTIRLLLEGLQDGAFRRQILDAGLRDMTDTATEHGGLVMADEGGKSLRLVNYKPLYEQHDHAYVASDALLDRMPLGIAAYHFHFQQVKNQAHASPGLGDLKFVARTRVNSVVFTSVGKGRFNADFYTPAGAVVDLGVYEAP